MRIVLQIEALIICLALVILTTQPRAAGPEDPASWRAEVQGAVSNSPTDISALITRGEYYLWLGNLSFAEADARSALAADWQSTKAWDLLSRALEQRGMPAEALAAIEKCGSFGKLELEQRIRLGGLRLRCGDSPGGEAELAAAQQGESSAQVLTWLAEQYAMARQVHASVKSIERALEQGPNAAMLDSLAKSAALIGVDDLLRRCSEAVPTDGQVAAAVPSASLQEDPQALLAQAEKFRAGGQFDSALDAAAKALQLAPEMPGAHDSRARTLAALGDPQAAQHEWRLSLDLDPSPERYLALAEALADTGDQIGATEAFAEMLGKFPRHSVALKADADRLYSQGKYEAAAQAYEQAARSSVRDPDLLNMSANCYYKLGRYKEAIGLYRRSLDLGFDAEVAANLCRALGKQEGDGAALRELARFIADHTDDARLFKARADVLYGLGKAEEALKDFEEAARLDPQAADCLNGAGLCLLDLGRTEKALAQFEAAAKATEEIDYFENAVYAASLLGQWESVLRLASDGLKSSPGHSALLVEQSKALSMLGRKAEALASLTQAASAAADPRIYVEAVALASASADAEAERKLWDEALMRFPSDYGLASAYAEHLRAINNTTALLNYAASVRPVLGSEYGRLLDSLAAAWLGKGQAADAEAFFGELISKNSKDADAYAQLALVQAAQQQFVAGLDTIKRGLNDAGSTYLGRYLECYLTGMTSGADLALPLARSLVDSPEVEPNGYLLLLRLLEEQGVYGEQVEQALIAQQRFPTEGRVLQYLARGMYFTGDSAAAVDVLTTPGVESMNCPLRDEILGSAYLDLGNWTRAAAHLTQASARNPGSADLQAALGQALLELGQMDPALDALEAALELAPELPAAHVWRGMLELERSSVEGARAQFDLVLRSPQSGKDDLAWATIGLARLALVAGDAGQVRLLLDKAQAYGYNTDAFYNACDALEASLPADDGSAQQLAGP